MNCPGHARLKDLQVEQGAIRSSNENEWLPRESELMTAFGRSSSGRERRRRARSCRKQPDCDGVHNTNKDAITALLIGYREGEIQQKPVTIPRTCRRTRARVALPAGGRQHAAGRARTGGERRYDPGTGHALAAHPCLVRGTPSRVSGPLVGLERLCTAQQFYLVRACRDGFRQDDAGTIAWRFLDEPLPGAKPWLTQKSVRITCGERSTSCLALASA